MHGGGESRIVVDGFGEGPWTALDGYVNIVRTDMDHS